MTKSGAAFGSLFFLDNLGCARHNAQANLAFCSHLHEILDNLGGARHSPQASLRLCTRLHEISELMCEHAQKENGLHGLLEIMIQSMMVAEREEFPSENQGIRAKAFVRGIPMAMVVDCSSRDRYGNFHPQIPALLRNQEEDFERFVGEPLHQGTYAGAGQRGVQGVLRRSLFQGLGEPDA